MTKYTFAIMGATGHIGHPLTEELLKKGHKVRVLGRDAHKLQEFKNKGAEVFSGDSTDSAFLAKMFKGCNAVFGLLPLGLDADDMEVLRDKTAEAIVQAVAKAKTTHVLNLSSIGANLPSGTGPIKEFYHQEDRLNLVPNLNVLHFRPAYFMENLLWSIPSIKSSGMITSSLKGDIPIPMVATQDIALKIAEFFDALKFTGSSVFEFVGPQEITMAEAAKVIGKAIGKPDLKYKQMSDEQAENEMIASGMKHQIAKLIVEMNRAFNERKIKPTQKLTEDHKGKTTFEEFCKTFSKIYHPGKKAA
ncbi:MAG TPA: NAD(P)H-binding protein [Rhabdochlamydiaceae bacterium]|nr:NAD(P)H-binding protein [Rhabdochlamydiaceae bacterium]